ncbi:MAG: hypothetical protein AB1767_12440 [Bacillota bacterium]
MFTVREVWSNWRTGDYWWVQSLYITPEHRSKELRAYRREGFVDAPYRIMLDRLNE